MAEFINPYTFVPLPASVDRARPAGHDRAAAAGIAGRVTVTWTLRTPLLLPNGHGRVTDGEVVVPGSSVKGVLRSLHETLMGGCLRVLDDDFVPVYRQPAVAKGDRWRLGVVAAATREGRATRVRVADKVVWVELGALPAAANRLPGTGDRVSISYDEHAPLTGLGRVEVTDPAQVTAGGPWVVMVGDAGTRGQSERFFCAAGLLPAETDPGRAVTAAAWAEYLRLCEGTNDMRRARQARRDTPGAPRDGGSPMVMVRWQGRDVGRRRRVTGRLKPGDVVWAHVDPGSGDVDHLSMAAIWRQEGRGTLGDRVPPRARACTDWCELCVSCRVFGAADTTGADADREADQRSYAGHVRIGDAVARGVTTVTEQRLAPMGAPRPGAGQFYLHIDDTSQATDEGQLPSALWGGRHDDSGYRLVRGRKFYWHGDPTATRPARHQARSGQTNEDMTGARELVPAGTVFTQMIWFDNLSPVEVGSLLLTLMPGLALPMAEGRDPQATTYMLHLGGGKPLGLGSCTVEVTQLRWWDAADRYRGQQPTDQAPREFFTPTLRGEVARLAGREARRFWPTLSRVLRADAVDPTLVWYPLGGEWGDERMRDRSFRFFSRTNGRFLTRREPIVPLPDPDPAARHDQRLRTV